MPWSVRVRKDPHPHPTPCTSLSHLNREETQPASRGLAGPGCPQWASAAATLEARNLGASPTKVGC